MAIEDHHLRLCWTNGETQVVAEPKHAIKKLLQPDCRPGHEDDIISIYQRRHLTARAKLHTSMGSCVIQMRVKPIQEDAKQSGAEGAPLTHPILLGEGRTGCTTHIHGQSATGIQRLDGCQHAWADANEPQAAPQEHMLDCVICLLKVHKADVEGLAGDEGTINEVPEGKEVMDG